MKDRTHRHIVRRDKEVVGDRYLAREGGMGAKTREITGDEYGNNDKCKSI